MPSQEVDSTLDAIGSYDILDKLGEGGMGSVYKACHRDSGEIVAIKTMPAHLTTNTVLVRRFEQEFHVSRTLEHPNIVRSIDFGRHNNAPYLVMEFVEGESLGNRLERLGKIAEPEAVRIIAQVAKALHKAHKKGLIHRDVKPDNILLTSDGLAKLADLGLVKETDGDLNLTRTGRGLGTPNFMSPEQFRKAKEADVRCDIYSLAATLYMMVTGKLPFESCDPVEAWVKKVKNELPAPRQLVPELSERIDWAIRRSMHSDPDQRASNCRDFIEDLIGRGTRRVEISDKDRWYLFFEDDDGEVRSGKGTSKSVRRGVQDGRLGEPAKVRASRSKSGPFEPLRKHPEFRDLVVLPAAPTPVSVSCPTPMPKKLEADRIPHPPTPVTMAFEAPVGLSISGPGPMIEFAPQARKAPSSSTSDWVKWAVVFAMALAAGLGGYFLMPILSRLRF